MVDKTLYKNEESTRKRLTMAKPAYEWLKSDNNASMTKGLKLYEVISYSLDSEVDYIDTLEGEVDDKLADLSSEDFVKSLQKIKSQNNFEDITGGPNVEDVKYVNVHIPDTFDQEVDSYGLGRQAEDAIQFFIESPFQSRMDRMECKKDLIQYIQFDRDPSHLVAVAIVRGQSEVVDVQDIHKELMDITGGWYRSDDLTIDTLVARGKEIPQSQTQDRINALETAIENSYSYDLDEHELSDLIKECFRVRSEPTIQKYKTMIDSEHTVDSVTLDFITLMNTCVAYELDADEYNEMSLSEKREYVNIPKMTNLEAKSGDYSREQALSVLQDVKNGVSRRLLQGNANQNAYENFKGSIKLMKQYLNEDLEDEELRQRLERSEFFKLNGD